jgi:hypothetical protein
VPGELAAPCKPHLTCNPNLGTTGECVANCSTHSLCEATNDYDACPDGESCAPITLSNDDPDSFHACRALGDSGSSRCDDNEDCIAEMHCTAEGLCANDLDLDDTCNPAAPHPQCDTSAQYCNATTLECTQYTGRGDICVRDTSITVDECNPDDTVGCIYDPDEEDTVCASQKRANGVVCLINDDCRSGLCEQIEVGGELVCFAGGESGDSCDDDPGYTEEAPNVTCGPGLLCRDSECIPMLLPGEDCEDDGAADSEICANETCSNYWNSNEYMCTDLQIPVANYGSNATCDGV